MNRFMRGLNPPTFSSPVVVVFDPNALHVSPSLLKSKHVSTIAISRRGSYIPILALVSKRSLEVEKRKKLFVIGINRNRSASSNLENHSISKRSNFFHHFNRVKYHFFENSHQSFLFFAHRCTCIFRPSFN